MTTHSREFTIGEYFGVIKRQRWLILLIGIIAAGAVFGLSAAQKKKYSATASIQVTDPNATNNLAGSGGAFLAETPLQLAATAAPQVTRTAVLQGVKQQLQSSLTPTQLQNLVAVTIDPNSYALQIAVESRNPQQAAQIANAFATVDADITTAAARASYRSQAKAVQKKLKHASQSLQVLDASTLSRLQNLATVAQPLQVTQKATVPTSPSSPKPARNTIAALVLGLLLGIAIGLAREALDRRLRSVSDITAEVRHPVVGQIPGEALGAPRAARGSGKRKNSAVTLSPRDEEAFRILRQNVTFLTTEQSDRTVLVTSPMPQEGKSTVAAGLAMACAQAGQRVLLVECDFRRPVVAERFGLRPSPGLTDYLTGNASPQDIIQPTPITTMLQTANGNGNSALQMQVQGSGSLVCITAGTQVPLPAELLASKTFGSFVSEVGGVYDVIVLDTPPLLPLADTLGVVPVASSVLLCARLGQTTRDQLRSAQAALERVSAPPLALVVTGVKEDSSGYYGYYGSPRMPAAETTTTGP